LPSGGPRCREGATAGRDCRQAAAGCCSDIARSKRCRGDPRDRGLVISCGPASSPTPVASKATGEIPAIYQVPERYRPLFTAGCNNATVQRAPARLSGSFKLNFQVEVYRTVFMPIILQPNWSKQLIFGSFNSRTVVAVDRTAP